MLEAVSRSVGMIIIFGMGAFLDYFNIAYVGAVTPVLAALLLTLTPESPVFLASQGHLGEAEQSLRFD